MAKSAGDGFCHKCIQLTTLIFIKDYVSVVPRHKLWYLTPMIFFSFIRITICHYVCTVSGLIMLYGYLLYYLVTLILL